MPTKHSDDFVSITSVGVPQKGYDIEGHEDDFIIGASA